MSATKTRYNISLPPDLHRAIKARAGLTGMTISGLVEEWARAGLARRRGLSPCSSCGHTRESCPADPDACAPIPKEGATKTWADRLEADAQSPYHSPEMRALRTAEAQAEVHDLLNLLAGTLRHLPESSTIRERVMEELHPGAKR